jgi:hypothetical protein
MSGSSGVVKNAAAVPASGTRMDEAGVTVILIEPTESWAVSLRSAPISENRQRRRRKCERIEW